MNIESVIEKCNTLKLKAIAQHLEQTTAIAEQRNWTSLQTIDHLLDLELQLRRKNKIERCFKQSKLYEKTTIDQFDFSFHSSRKNQKSRILNLMDLGFIEHRKDIILIGNPGVGKSFLAKCMAYAATQAGIKILFTTAMDMINHLIAAEADHSLLKKLQHYQSQ
jgi:DNA replication protein DnaC